MNLMISTAAASIALLICASAIYNAYKLRGGFPFYPWIYFVICCFTKTAFFSKVVIVIKYIYVFPKIFMA